MGTIARDFYGREAEDDGAYGLDVRKFHQANPGTNTQQSTARFTNNPAGTLITFDPYTVRVVLGASDAFGWCVNFGTADGMQSTADAKRMINAGTWQLRGRWTPHASIPMRLRFRVYRVAAAPGRDRTLLFEHIGPSTTGVGQNFDYTTGAQSEIILEADESIQVTPIVEALGATGLVDVDINFGTGAGALGESHWIVTVPAPGIRTFFPRSFTAVLSLGIAAVKRAIGLPRAGGVMLAGAFDKNMALVRARQASLTLGGALARTARLRRVRAAAAALGGSFTKSMRLPRSAVFFLSAARLLRVGRQRTASLSLSAVLSPLAIRLGRSASLTLMAAMDRALTLRRAFGGAVIFGAKAFAKMLVALIPAGGGVPGASRFGVLIGTELVLTGAFIKSMALNRPFSSSLPLAASSSLRIIPVPPPPDPLDFSNSMTFEPRRGRRFSHASL